MRVLLTLLSLAVCQFPSANEHTLENSEYHPFPKGYGYQQETEKLDRETANGNANYIREHAWRLWAGVMQPMNSGWPIWMSWPNTGTVFFEKRPQKSRIAEAKVSKPLRANGKAHFPRVNTNAPAYPVPQAVLDKYPDSICTTSKGKKTVCDGKYFVNNGDIMIATESLNRGAARSLKKSGLTKAATLDRLFANDGENAKVSNDFIVTKHMYWPVKADGLTAVPVWEENFAESFPGYAGYERWGSLIAIDPSGNQDGKVVDVEYLYGLQTYNGKSAYPTVEGKARVHSLSEFYARKVTRSDWNAFSEEDKAIIDSASIWANGRAFAVGDYLVTIAMHINTKEIDSWTLQSVWWSNRPNEGPYAQNKPQLSFAAGPWSNYLLTTSYAVPAEPDGKVKVAVNPYIEGVTHPIATSCRNCHVRAGWPQEDKEKPDQVFSSYQNPKCPDLLADLKPESECFDGVTLTDYLWIIPDRAH